MFLNSQDSQSRLFGLLNQVGYRGTVNIWMIIEYDERYKQQAMAIGRRMHQESRFKDFRFDENQIERLINHANSYVLLSVVDEQVVGFFVGIVTPHWFGPDLVGQDLGLYIDKEHRGGTMAVRFMKRFEQYCKTRGCVTVVLGSSADISTDAARRLYTGLGYTECGFLAHKEI